jgi:hypothetical protein
VVDEKAGGTSEFIMFQRDDLNNEFLVGKIGSGKFNALGCIAFINIPDTCRSARTAWNMKRSQLFRSTRLLFRPARSVIVLAISTRFHPGATPKRTVSDAV